MYMYMCLLHWNLCTESDGTQKVRFVGDLCMYMYVYIYKNVALELHSGAHCTAGTFYWTLVMKSTEVQTLSIHVY